MVVDQGGKAASSALLLQERQRLHLNLLGDLLQALEGEVALSSLHATHVGAVRAKDFSKGFLTAF